MNVPDTVREISKNDLLEALLRSNRLLAKQVDVTPSILKNQSELYMLAENTERSIYKEHGNDYDTYIETVLTILVFLEDRGLTRDLVIFRLLLNVSIDDIYKVENLPSMLLTEINLCNADTDLKKICIQNITQQIGLRLNTIRKRYSKSEPYIHADMYYYIPHNMRLEMNKFRDKSIADITNKIFENDNGGREQDDLYDNLSELSKSYAESDVSSIADSFRDSDNDHIDLEDTNLLELKSSDDEVPDEVPEAEEDEDEESDYSEIPEEIMEMIEPEPEVGDKKALLESLNLPNAPSNSCEKCSQPFQHTYCTPILENGGHRIVYFCSSRCMEKWDI